MGNAETNFAQLASSLVRGIVDRNAIQARVMQKKNNGGKMKMTPLENFRST